MINDAQFDRCVQFLGELVAIPTVSDPSSPDHEMEGMKKAADLVVKRLKEMQFDARCESIDGSPPFILASRIVHPKKRTILLYAHYDVQPVDRDHWDTDPFQLVRKNDRLFGRGASDDKGGIAAILAALGVYHDAKKELPVNIKILFEGEEEYNSTHMEPLLEKHAKILQAAALVILDGPNKAVDTGSLSSSTRGFKNIEIRVDALKKPIHSGLSCLAPDPIQALAGLITSVQDPIKIPGFMDGAPVLTEEERKLLRESSVTEKEYSLEAGAVHWEGSIRGDPSLSIYERVMETPTISFINMTSGKKNGGNSIQASARCTMNIRVLPGQDPDHVGHCVIDYLLKQPVLYNLPVTLSPSSGDWGWKANLAGPLSKKYLQALEKHFPKTSAMPGGGTLPLLRTFEKAFPKMEMILPGVLDPASAPHSHNESQEIHMLRNSINSLVTFLELASE